jgi:hypothetical protein
MVSPQRNTSNGGHAGNAAGGRSNLNDGRPPWILGNLGSPNGGHPAGGAGGAAAPTSPAASITADPLALRNPRTHNRAEALERYHTHMAYNVRHNLNTIGMSASMYHLPINNAGQHGRAPPPPPGGPPPQQPAVARQPSPGGAQPPGHGGALPPGQNFPPGMVYPVITFGTFQPDLDKARSCVERERTALGIQQDNAVLMPNANMLSYDSWDANATHRMCHVFWPQYREHLLNCANAGLAPLSASDHRHQINTRFPSLANHLGWNNGVNENLAQMLGEIYPWYHKWLNTFVLPPTISFRQPHMDAATAAHQPLDSTRLDALAESISMSNAFGDSTEPVPTVFNTTFNQRERTCYHLFRVTEILSSWITMAGNNIFTGSYTYVFANWTQADTTP